MSDQADFLESFSVACPRCDCQFQPDIRQTSYFAKCPDCAEPVRVPASAEVEDDWQREQAAESDGETYRLSVPTDWDNSEELDFSAPATEPESPPKVRDQPPADSWTTPQTDAESPPAKKSAENTDKPGASAASCPACGANFETPISDLAQVVLCPECLEDVHVPAGRIEESPPPVILPSGKADSTKSPKQEPAAWETDDIHFDEYSKEPATPKKRKKKRRKKSAADMTPVENPRRGVKLEKSLNDVMAEIRQVEKDPPPEWTFFSGVTDFLIRPEVLVRWVFASIGFCVLGWLCAMCAYFYASTPMALPFFVIPLFWIGIMTLSYTAACSMPILLETAAGSDKIEGWPEPVMKEQAIDLIYLSFLLIVVEVLSFFLGLFAGVLIGPPWLVFLVLTFLLYPIVLLSSLEANSPYVPLTLPILNSLKTVTWAWGAFYGLSFGLTMIWVVPIVWAFGKSGWTQFFTIIFVAPLLVGWCFLYARLLGRLAWRASLEMEEEDEEEETEADDAKPQRKKTKKKRPGNKQKPKVSESSGELQAAH